MADIFMDFPIKATPARVFEALSTPRGLDTWWTKRSAGRAAQGAEFELWFGPEHDWRARVTRCVTDSSFELEVVRAQEDWMGTRVGANIESRADATNVRFYHTGWPTANEHWRISCYCWAMYLRILRRNLEHGETVPYEKRLDV
jgi:uncharacterized protein YndB with AHSA1/START domain